MRGHGSTRVEAFQPPQLCWLGSRLCLIHSRVEHCSADSASSRLPRLIQSTQKTPLGFSFC